MMISIKVCSEIDGFGTYLRGIVTSYGPSWRGKTAPILIQNIFPYIQLGATRIYHKKSRPKPGVPTPLPQSCLQL